MTCGILCVLRREGRGVLHLGKYSPPKVICSVEDERKREKEKRRRKEKKKKKERRKTTERKENQQFSDLQTEELQ